MSKQPVLLVNEVFTSIQGEGRYAGHPMMFIRLAGCTRSCSWCDTKYHDKVNVELSPKEMRELVGDDVEVCFTGGEPLKQWSVLKEMLLRLPLDNRCHLETNGDLLIPEVLQYFKYVVVSPKEASVAKKADVIIPHIWRSHGDADIKVVTDGREMGMDMVDLATMLMPFTSGDKEEDQQTKVRVWQLCIMRGLIYSPRLHIDVWGGKRGV